jgi:hypothetical protein
MTGTLPCLTFIGWVVVLQIFCQNWPKTANLLISASQIVRITGMSYRTQLLNTLYTSNINKGLLCIILIKFYFLLFSLKQTNRKLSMPLSILFIGMTKYTRQLKRRNIYYGSQFQRFQFMVTWLHYFLTCNEAELHGRECVLECSCSPHGGQDQREKKKKEPGSQYVLQRLISSMIYFFQLVPTS